MQSDSESRTRIKKFFIFFKKPIDILLWCGIIKVQKGLNKPKKGIEQNEVHCIKWIYWNRRNGWNARGRKRTPQESKRGQTTQGRDTQTEGTWPLLWRKRGMVSGEEGEKSPSIFSCCVVKLYQLYNDWVV